MEKHDEHYATKKIETIDIIEQRIDNPGSIPNKPLFCITHAMRYLDRAGLKDGQPWGRDVEKAINYLTRALTGSWVGGEAIKEPTAKTILPPEMALCPWCGACNHVTNIHCLECERYLDGSE